LEDINSSFELEEIVSNEEDKEMEERIKRREMERKLEIFARESVWFKRIPIPDGRSEESFQRDIKEAFKKVLPETMVEGFLPKHCGLCDEQFEELKWAHKHYTGYNHRGAIKSFLKGTFQIHPPYFKMVWEAIQTKHPEGLTTAQIIVFIMGKFNVGEDMNKIEQFIHYGIERLEANDYIKKENNMYTVVDINRSLDIKAGTARVNANKSTRDALKEFENKMLDEFQDDLPLETIKSLKPDYCGLCHRDINDSGWFIHYTGSAHRRVVELFKCGRYKGYPSYKKMMEQYFANENPSVLSEKDIVRFIMKNFKVEADENKIHFNVQKILESILDKSMDHSSTENSSGRKYGSRTSHDERRGRRSDQGRYSRGSRSRSRSRETRIYYRRRY